MYDRQHDEHKSRTRKGWLRFIESEMRLRSQKGGIGSISKKCKKLSSSGFSVAKSFDEIEDIKDKIQSLTGFLLSIKTMTCIPCPNRLA